jgi:hypothetical protein
LTIDVLSPWYTKKIKLMIVYTHIKNIERFSCKTSKTEKGQFKKRPKVIAINFKIKYLAEVFLGLTHNFVIGSKV